MYSSKIAASQPIYRTEILTAERVVVFRELAGAYLVQHVISSALTTKEVCQITVIKTVLSFQNYFPQPAG